MNDYKENAAIAKSWAEKVSKKPLDKYPTEFAFYGSLRKGHYNYERLVSKAKGLKFEGTEVIPGFQMFSLGSYPCVVYTGNEADKITVELFSIPDELIARQIDMMELGAGYGRREVTINKKVYTLYEYPDRGYGTRGYPKVQGGDWSKYQH